jgi:hypothetical protein
MRSSAFAAASLAAVLALAPSPSSARGSLAMTEWPMLLAQAAPPPLPAPALTPPPLPQPQPPAAAFFYNGNGKPVGPLSIAEIQAKIAAGEIKPGTLVWKSGTPSWVPAKDLPEIASLLPKEMDFKAFFVGTWEAQTAGPAGTTGLVKIKVTANADGTLQGTYTATLAESGAVVNIPISGTWSVQGTGEKRFTLNLVLRMQAQGQTRTQQLSAHLEVVDDNTLRDVDSGELTKRVAS